MSPRNLLLVEGADDMHVLYSLLKHHDVPITFKIKDKKGVTNILETLDVEIDASGLERLGIVVDADLDIESRWRSLRNLLSSCGYESLPEMPSPEGTIIDKGRTPAVGIWIMPDNIVPGMLEHFVSVLIPVGDPLWATAEQVVNTIPAEYRRFADQHQIKAHLHTWLAWQDDPGTPLGLAITKRYFDAGAEQARTLIAWIRRLFETDPPSI